MNAEEKRIAEELLEEMPEQYRVPYCLYHGSGLSMAEIAEQEGIPESTVRQRLAKAQKFLSFRVKRLIVGYLVFELFNADVSAMTNDALAQIGLTVPEAETVATIGTATVAGAAGKSWTSTLGSLALAVVQSCWIFLLYASGFNAVKALVRETPTLEARRWLVKQLMVFYCAVLALPCAFLLLDFLHDDLGLSFNIAIVFIATLYSSLAALTLFAVLSVRMYAKMCGENITVTLPDHSKETFALLARFLKRGVVLSSLLLIGILLFNGYGFVRSRGNVFLNPGKNIELFLLMITGLVSASGVFIGLHIYVVRLFRFFAKHSKDGDTFSAFLIRASEVDAKERARHEAAFIVPFLVVNIASWPIHFLFIRSDIVYFTFEIFVIGGLWCWIWKLNVNDNSLRWIRIVTLALTQFALVVLSRLFFL